MSLSDRVGKDDFKGPYQSIITQRCMQSIFRVMDLHKSHKVKSLLMIILYGNEWKLQDTWKYPQKII